jgi:hypothetical protein
VERVVLNALFNPGGFRHHYFAIVFGEADPPGSASWTFKSFFATVFETESKGF